VSHADRVYVPAAGRDWLLPLYDPLQWMLGGNRVRAAMFAAAGLRPGMRILDVGCGTGSLTVELLRGYSDLDVSGLDPDPRALRRARRKLARAGLEARLDEGFADALPYAEDSFDRVFSSFMFHHLSRPVKEGMLREVHRVLVPGGVLHLADFGGEARAHGLARLLHRSEALAENFGGGIRHMAEAAGFGPVRELPSRRSLLGRVVHYQAQRSS
jgi:ubiquinone/menaquinone biosynthesis C-methylase UbiE